MKALTEEQLEESIYEIIGRALPTELDPFWVQLFDGTLPIEGMQHWAKQMYFITQEFGRYTSAIHANCPIFEVRHTMAQTLYEEHGHMVDGKDHPELFRKFARALGIPDTELDAAERLPETEALLDWLLDLCLHRNFVEALAGFGVAVEGQASKGIPLFIHVFRDKLGLPADALEFWTTHAEDDIEHGRRSMDIVLRYATTPSLQAGVLECVRKSMQRLMLFHHGVGRRYFESVADARVAVNA